MLLDREIPLFCLPSICRACRRLHGTCKTEAEKESLLVRSFTLTPTLDQTLQVLSQETSYTLGWTVSTSAIVRALLRSVAQHPPSWALSHLFLFVEHEIGSGMVWGKNK